MIYCSWNGRTFPSRSCNRRQRRKPCRLVQSLGLIRYNSTVRKMWKQAMLKEPEFLYWDFGSNKAGWSRDSVICLPCERFWVGGLKSTMCFEQDALSLPAPDNFMRGWSCSKPFRVVSSMRSICSSYFNSIQNQGTLLAPTIVRAGRTWLQSQK
jgi:hypothetical protein